MAFSTVTQKPVVLIDMDGPLAAFDKKFYDLSRKFFGQWTFDFDNDELDPVPVQKRFMTDNMAADQAKAMRAYINDTRWFRDLPVTEGAQEGMKRLEQVEDIDVWICTKPLEANATCRDDKAAWLAEHFGEQWVNKMIIAPDKSLVRGALLLDDAIKPEWVPHAPWKPVVFEEPFNGPGTKHGADWPRFSWDMSIYTLLSYGGI